jgi:hypothetical protein
MRATVTVERHPPSVIAFDPENFGTASLALTRRGIWSLIFAGLYVGNELIQGRAEDIATDHKSTGAWPVIHFEAMAIKNEMLAAVVLMHGEAGSLDGGQGG